MAKAKVAISLDKRVLRRVDDLVRRSAFPSRSEAIRTALEEKLVRLDRGRLARECAKLTPAEEKGLAEEGMVQELSDWPEY